MTTSERPLVTIGIPTYNRADSYLPQALGSAVGQTYPNVEIVVSDNCSSDRTEEVVKGFDHPGIRYFKQERNIGPVANFNVCLEHARGAYFLMLHDDDLIDPDFLDVCLSAAQDRTDYGLIRTGMRKIDADGHVIGEQPNRAGGLSPEDLFRAWFKGGVTPMHLPSTLFNTGFLLEVGGFESPRHLFDDVVPEARLAARYERVDIEEVKASYRMHETKYSTAVEVEDWCIDSRYLLEVILGLFDDADPSFRRAGMQFFAKHCLAYARAVESWPRRLAAYRLVHRSFDHTTPLLARALVVRPVMKIAKRGARRIKGRGR
jgi:glycosyltransferase involved in cell wall biosynthesis